MKILLRKRISVILILAMIITTIPFAKASADTSGTFKDADGNVWAYDVDRNTGVGLDNSTYSVGPATSTSVSGSAIVPSIINGKAVTSIAGNSAGWYSESVTSLTIPSSIVNIESMAFTGWSKLEEVKFESDSKLRVIQRYAFGSCTKLRTITIPASVEEIGVFYTYPAKQTGYHIFDSCTSLESIQVEDGSTHFKAVDGVLYSYDGSVLYAYPASKSEISYEIPASVEVINESAFFSCLNLKSIAFAPGSKLFKLGDRVFSRSTKLSEINGIPSTLVEFGDWAFGETAWLKSQINPENPFIIINNVLVYAYYNLPIPTEVTFPNHIVKIGKNVLNYAKFEGSTSLTIPASVTQIDYGAFYGKDNIASIQFANDSNLEIIGANAFYDCNSINTFNIPDKVTTIGDSAFASMKGLRSIAIPNSVTSVGNTIFYNDNQLEYIYTDNEYIKTSELHEQWGSFNYSFEPYENYSKDPLTGTVDITGETKVGETLTAVTTGITIELPGNLTYKWYKINASTNKVDLNSIGNNSTYTITKDDVGYKIKLTVSAANYSGSLSVTSTTVPKASCPEANVPVSGVVHNDGTNKSFTFTGLVGVDYEYSLDNGVTWNYAGTLNGSDGESATGTISIGNTAIEKGGLQVRARETVDYSASISITNDKPFTATLSGTVKITGTLKYNETLSADVTEYPSNAVLTYNWYRSGTSTPIHTSTSNKYLITGEDVGKTLSVKVSANSYTGNLEVSTSAIIEKATAVITIPNENRTYLKTYGYADFDLEGISNNVSGSYTYKISHPDVLSIAPDGKVHIIKAMDGTCTIEVGLAQSNYYTTPQSISVFINVGKADKVLISLSNLNQVSDAITKPTVTMNPYSKAAFDKIKVEYGVMMNDIIEWSESLPTKEGNYKVRATLASTDANLDPNIKLFQDATTEEQAFIITKYDPSNGGENPNPGGENPNPGSENPGGNPNTGGGNPSTGENTNPDSSDSETDSKDSTVVNEDGSTTKTNTKENADGSSTTTTITVNKDGSKTEKETISSTVKNKDGSSKTTESIRETITAADGTSFVISTRAEISTNTNGTSTKKTAISLDSTTATAVKTNKTDKDGNIISSVATIITNESKVSVSKTTATVGINIPADLLKAVADSSNSTDVTFKVDTDIAKAAITDKKVTSVTLALNVPTVKNVNIKGTNLSKDVANLASKYKKNLTINVDDQNGVNYSVKITSGDLSKVKKDLNLSLEVSKYEEIAKENTKLASAIKGIVNTNSSSIQIVSFSDNKTLETGLTLSYDLSDMTDVKAGDKVYIYRYNSKTNKLEEIPNNSIKVSQNTTITTTTIQGGDFVVSPDKLTGKQVTKLIDKITVNTDKTSVKAGSKSNVVVTLPVDVLKVNNFNTKSNPIGKEEAQVTYKVNDESIAKVDSKGNITTKKTGNVIVTVTIKLENGQKKTYKKTIQVK